MVRAALFAVALACPALAFAQDPPEPQGPPPAPEQPAPEEPAPEEPAPEEPAPEEPAEPETPETPETPEEKRARKKAEKAAKKDGRELDPNSPEAEALADLLNVEANYGKEGDVALTYTFREPTHISDWDQSGFDVAEESAGRVGRRRRRANKNRPARLLALSVGSQGKGTLLHRLTLTDNYEITYKLRVDRMTTRSQLVFFVGKAGAAYGNAFVKRSGSGFKSISRKVKPNAEPFEGNNVEVKLKAQNGELSTYVNGSLAGRTEKLTKYLPGRVGLFVTDMTLVVNEVVIKGVVDKKKL